MKIIHLDQDLPEVWTIGPAVEALKQGELVVVPTDTMYALACDPWSTKAVSRLYRAKNMHATKRCAVACSNLKDVGAIARAVGTDAFRFMRRHLPGPYTLILHAARSLPRQATGRRKTIGIRIPNDPVAQALMASYGGPILVSSLPGWEDDDLVDPVSIAERLPVRPAVVLDQSIQRAEPSTVVDFSVSPAELIRMGAGEVETADL